MIQTPNFARIVGSMLNGLPKNRVAFQDELTTLIRGDYNKILTHIPDGSIDLVCTDIPYGVTDAVNDEAPEPAEMFALLKAKIKPSGVILLFCQQPLTSRLVMANEKQFRFDFAWDKKKVTGHLNAKKRPLRRHESILVFSGPKPTYNPQMTEGKPYKASPSGFSENYKDRPLFSTENNGTRYPTTILERFPQRTYKGGHPQQKPVELLENLILTYSNEGETVLDFTCGSGTALVAARKIGRSSIGVELQERWIRKAIRRIKDEAPFFAE